MGLDTNFSKAKKAVEAAVLNTELTKEELVQTHISEWGRNKGNNGREPKPTPPAQEISNANHKKTTKALEPAKLAIIIAGVKAFELYGT